MSNNPNIDNIFLKATGFTRDKWCTLSWWNPVLVDSMPNQNQPFCCEPGFYLFKLQKRDCRQCPIGQFRANISQSPSCNKCPMNTIAASFGDTKCVNCTSGTYTDLARDTCKTCAAGKVLYKQNKIGSWQGDTGKIKCRNCDPGYYQDQIGAVKCMGCPSGWYQPEPSKTFCFPCNRKFVCIHFLYYVSLAYNTDQYQNSISLTTFF